MRLISIRSLELLDLTRTSTGSRFEKLPRVEAAPVGVVDVRVRPIFENSTACTKSNAKNPAHCPLDDVRDSFGNRLNIQSKSVMICSVSFKLAIACAYSGVVVVRKHLRRV